MRLVILLLLTVLLLKHPLLLPITNLRLPTFMFLLLL